MTGFKSGASSDDPLGSGGNSSDDNDATDTSSDRNDHSGSGDFRSKTSESETTKQNFTPASAPVDGELPWIYHRNSITDGREKTVQLHLQNESLERERQQKSTIQEELGESVKKADLREAALLVGLEHIDEVAKQLREWGYDIE